MAQQMSKNKQTNLLVAAALKAGWRVEKRNSGHIMFFCAEDGCDAKFTFCSTPGNKNDFQRNAQRLRRHGVNI